MYIYFLTMRPPSIGTHPKENLKSIEGFDYRKKINLNGKNINAWGWVGYSKPLTRKQAEDYELIGDIYAD